jgi:hypothetical protein
MTDLGNVVAVAWSDVTIKWDDGHTTSLQRNDMTKVERALANLNWGAVPKEDPA